MKLPLIAVNITLNFSDFGKYCFSRKFNSKSNNKRKEKTKTKQIALSQFAIVYPFIVFSATFSYQRNWMEYITIFQASVFIFYFC